MTFQLKASSKQRRDISYGKIITKSFDLGDVGLIKKFTRVNITYRMDGVGPSRMRVAYSIDEQIWKDLDNVSDNAYSYLSPYKNSYLKKTNGVDRVASFKFPKRTSGHTISIKIFYTSTGDTYGGVGGFQLSDIGFTYRAIQRK
jgi:hypothetical protein